MSKTTSTTIDLATRKGYDIAAAIRGPDLWLEAEMIKYVFTARIRWLAGARQHGYSNRSGRIDALKAQALQAECCKDWGSEMMDRAFSHCIRHIWEAARALGDTNLAELAGIMGYARARREISIEDIIELAGGD